MDDHDSRTPPGGLFAPPTALDLLERAPPFLRRSALSDGPMWLVSRRPGIVVAHLERIRSHLGIDRVILIGHSFGGIVAAEYAHRYSEHVAAVIMVDTTPNMPAAFSNQLAFIDSIAGTAFPSQAAAIHAIVASNN